MSGMRNSGKPLLAGFVFGVVFALAAGALWLRAEGVPLDVAASPGFRKFFAAFHDLSSLYYRPISNQVLLNGAIDGMTKSLGDPFTDYFPPAAATRFENMLSSSFDGIGIVIRNSPEGVVIASVNTNSPAQKAGLKRGDFLLSANGTPLFGLSLDKISTYITGPEGSQVVLVIHRPSSPTRDLTFHVTREKITQPSVTSKMLLGKIGYVQIAIVADATAAETANALHSLQSQGMKYLIVDLRGNVGGYLAQAVDIADQFVPKGDIIVQTQDRGQSAVATRSTGPGLQIPVAVLMDQNTASAAEVLAAALHADVGAPLVGTKSYGKGTVQVTQSYSDGSALKYTVARWLTPGGEWINQKGLTPTISVKLPDFVFLNALSELKLPLTQDQNDQDVADLQKTLTALGYGPDRTDGYFDASTTASVRRIQVAKGLPATGMVDEQTASVLDEMLNQMISRSDTQLTAAEKALQGNKVAQ